jgi:LPS-assembly protein
MARITPIFSAENGLLLNRQVKLFHTSYLQVLEPKLFYLFVPEKNQSDIPLFDTTLPPFDFSQLFRTNRFSGIDRVGDANQVSFAVITRLLDSNSGQEKLRAGLGQMYLFHYHDICLNEDCTLDPLASNKLSPLIGEMQYFINSSWNIGANLGWEPNSRSINNTSFNLQYLRDKDHLINLGYNFIRDGDTDLAEITNLDRINLSVSWPINTNWKFLGNWNYNLSHSYPQTYFYGLEYESCCWAVRIVQNHSFLGQDLNQRTTFNNTFYLQFLLKGLGNFGNSDTGTLLTNSIPGFKDNLATGLKL